MRIMQVIYSFAVGGSESVACSIALNMPAEHKHGIIALEKDGPLRDYLEMNRVPTFLINRKPKERLSPMLRIWRAMQEFKPEIVHTHHLYQLFYAWPGALLSGARIMHTEHEYYSLSSCKARFRLRQISRLCRKVTGVNEQTSSFLRNELGIPAPKVHTVVNGLDLERYKAGKFMRADIGLTDDDLITGIVARLHPVKDHSCLLQAFRLVVDQQSRAKLLIIGDGEERRALEQQVSQLDLGCHVQFLGTRSDIPELLSCLDLFVLSSSQEGLPLCILEAMAAGKPVVATEVGGIPSVVQAGKTGLLVPPQQPKALAESMLHILNNPALGVSMGKKGRSLVEQSYDLKQSIRAYSSLYQEVLN